MSNLLKLFFEFFKTGLFAVGGGLATIPFLQDMSERTGWFSIKELANMVAVSQSTPGPMGVNMAVYTGFSTLGIIGSLVAVLGLITPSIIIVMIIYKVYAKFKENANVKKIFYGIRPASVALITSALLTIANFAFLNQNYIDNSGIMNIFNIKALVFAVILYMATLNKNIKKLHPIYLILISAAIGILFKF